MNPNTSSFRSARARADLTWWLLLIFVFVVLFSIAVVSMEINLLMRMEAGEVVSEEALVSHDTRRTLSVFLNLGLLVAVVIAFLQVDK